METKQFIALHQEKFQNLIARDSTESEVTNIMFAYLRATTEALIEGHYGAEESATTKQPRKKPNKKNNTPPSGSEGGSDDEG